MKVVIIGATGTIGRSVVALLNQRHEVVTISRSSGDNRADIGNKASLEDVLAKIANLDAIICAAGSAAFKPLASLSDEDFATSLNSKLMGQVNVVRVGSRYVPRGDRSLLQAGLLPTSQCLAARLSAW